jgi:cytochrome P450
MCNEWSKFATSDTPVNINQEMTSLTATTAISLLFGKEHLEIKDAMLKFTKIGNRYASSIYYVLRWLFLPQLLSFTFAKKKFYENINRMINQHQQESNPAYNFLTLLLQAKDPDTQQSYPHQRIIDEIITIAVTGHETISNIVTWALYSIARNSSIAQQLHEEITTVLQGRAPTAEDLPHLNYTRMVIEETMRCYPVIWTVNRKTLKDDVINDYFIPAGSLVAVSIYNIHHNPKYWDQPNLFHPERFTLEKNRQRQRYAFIPFGAGPRNCIGSHFALIEAQLILTIILQRYEIHTINNDPVGVLPLITLKPSKNIMLKIKAR